MEKSKNQTKRILLLSLGIVLAVALIFLGVKLIHLNSSFLTVSCVTMSTNDGSYENESYGGKVTVNGVSMGDKTTFQLKLGQNFCLSAVANEGYLFAGYYVNNDLISDKVNYTTTLSEDSYNNVYAKFAKSVTLNINVANPNDKDDVRQISNTYYVGQKIDVAELVAEYCNVGWATDYEIFETEQANLTQDNKSIIVPAVATSVNIAPYVVEEPYIPVTYQVIFMKNSTDVFATKEVDENTTYFYPATQPKKDGYLFEGWSSIAGSSTAEWNHGEQTCFGDKTWYPIWSKITIPFAVGDGTKANPYQISTYDDLKNLSILVNKGVNFENKYFILTNDISINEGTNFVFDNDTGLVAVTNGVQKMYLGTGILGQKTGTNTTFDSKASEIGTFYSDKLGSISATNFSLNTWTPIGQINSVTGKLCDFAGTFDGNGHIISGVYVNNNSNNQGLFGFVSGSVKNLGVANSYICGNQNVGAIVATNNGTLQDVYDCAIVIAKTSTAGGIIGTLENNSYLINAYHNGVVYGSVYAGSICGLVNGTVENIYSYGKVYNKNNKSAVFGSVLSESKLKNIFAWHGNIILDLNATLISSDEIDETLAILNMYATTKSVNTWIINNQTGVPSFAFQTQK